MQSENNNFNLHIKVLSNNFPDYHDEDCPYFCFYDSILLNKMETAAEDILVFYEKLNLLDYIKDLSNCDIFYSDIYNSYTIIFKTDYSDL